MLAQLPAPFARAAAGLVDERLEVAARSLSVSECETVLRLAEEPQLASPQGLSAAAESLACALRALYQAGGRHRDGCVEGQVLCSKALAACRTVLLTRRLEACEKVWLFRCRDRAPRLPPLAPRQLTRQSLDAALVDVTPTAARDSRSAHTRADSDISAHRHQPAAPAA